MSTAQTIDSTGLSVDPAIQKAITDSVNNAPGHVRH